MSASPNSVGSFRGLFHRVRATVNPIQSSHHACFRTKLEFDQFGLHTTLEVKTIQALYYKAGKDRLLTIVLTRDLEGKRPDQMFYCTKLDWTAREILSAYACRWAIECTFENCKQFLGLEDPANRLPMAVARTAPMALFIYTLVVIWFHQGGGKRVEESGWRKAGQVRYC